MTLEEYFADHAALAQQWDPDRNTESPAALSVGSHKKVWMRCSRGHGWESRVYALTMIGSGCPYCMGKRAISGENDLATVRPELLHEWDYEKNTLDPREVLPSAHSKVWWRCELGHSYEAAVFSRAKEKGTRCPYCTGKKVLAGFNDLRTLHPKLAEQWYTPLNGALRPEDVNPGSNKKVWWRCSENHVWQAYIYARTRKKATGCPVCTGTVRQPRAEAPAGRARRKRTQSGEQRTGAAL